MITKEDLKNIVNTELNKISTVSSSTNRGEFILANDKTNILKSDIEKYNALLRMQELLDNNFSNLHSEFEFLDLSKLTGINLSEEDYQQLLNPNYLKIKDKDKIKGLINKILKESNTNRGEFVLANDSRSILKGEVQKYNALLRMQELIDNNFSNLEYKFEYEDLRDFVDLDNEKQEILNPQVVFDNEYKLVSDRIKKLQNTTGINFEKNIEYQNLLKMQNYLNNNFKDMPHTYDYLNLRKNTNLDRMEDNKYFMLISSKLPKKESTQPVANTAIEALEPIEVKEEKEIKPVIKNEEVEQAKQVNEVAEEIDTFTTNVDNDTLNSEEVLDVIPPQEVAEDTKVDTPVQNIEPNNFYGQKIKVVKKRPLAWLNEHRKQILIALAIAALVIAVITTFSYLIPALTSAAEIAEVSTLSTSMVNNAALWHTADAAVQTTLHAQNVALAQSLQNIAGIKTAYETATGIWTIGGMELSQFATAATMSAQNAIAATTTTANTLLGISTAGSLIGVLGAIVPNKKSDEYLKYKEKVQEWGALDTTAQHQLLKDIHNSNLSDNEKNRLLKKIDKLQNKIENYDKNIGR